ncbi:MAG: hypothetical protein ACP5US_02110 [Candidatus Kryptoniota bacterium]
MRISFLNIGNARKTDSTTYTFAITSPNENKIKSALAELSISNELFVNLPGTYGGRLLLNSDVPPQVMKNLVLTDSAQFNQNKYARQYWITYAGMGIWEGVINCYLKRDQKYYIISLVQDESLGKPGENNITADSLRTEMLKSLMDSTSATVQAFNKLVASLQISNQ